jgi:hypothetical protein
VTDHAPVYATNLPVVEPAIESAATNVAPIAPEPPPPRTNEIATSKPEPAPPPPAKQNPETPPAPVAKQKPPLPIVTILVAGIALLIAIMVVFLALLRWTKRSSGESLITRTMNKRDE